MSRRPHCPGSESTPGDVRSIYGQCGKCEMYVAIRRDGKLRKHYYPSQRDVTNDHQRTVRNRLGVDPMPKIERLDPDRRGEVEIIETTDGPITFEDPPPTFYMDRVDKDQDDSTSDDKTRRELGIGRKRWRINVVIEWWRST